MAVYRPADIADLVGIVKDARRLELRGGGSKRAIGTPGRDADIVDMAGLTGVVDYDPAELVLTVRAGTPLAVVQALVAGENQMLAFDPFDHGPVFGRAAGAATIGGIVAAGVAGSRRVSAGGVRDHLLGFVGVSGRGERFVAGAKVVKNVTGYDLPKLVCGSWGRLVALAEVTLKVLPRPRETTTRIFRSRSLPDALGVAAAAMRSPASVAAIAHVPGHLAGEDAITALRLEGFGPSIAARLAMLDTWPGVGPGETATTADADAVWGDLRTLAPLNDDRPLWRIAVPGGQCAALVGPLRRQGASFLIDWAGGLVWLAFDGDADKVRDAATRAGGHAMLVRANDAVRAAVPALHPQVPALAALEWRVRRAFDPAGVFECGRFGDAHAH